ncbi:hypothetical protein MPTK1_1g07030 [Marchantia polymorpha subsp. ruderalis]|uniref:Uncharacterized protein n=2 Tax=Marchantia polymorpha TaxID=3197 RepID=A0AAF6AME9_MARPO|nr:hypothetical protein MARPO_0043s0094 [Marchantia polymorpha]BBM97619.1 hypothetical protein Mp_1g07030 [Marchantia polymorpha subsp. ruderalis]|eukprot:PTQ39859.1 hypothetical protein MARPO_0043s0094 [Marchantia polymorpha]
MPACQARSIMLAFSRLLELRPRRWRGPAGAGGRDKPAGSRQRNRPSSGVSLRCSGEYRSGLNNWHHRLPNYSTIIPVGPRGHGPRRRPRRASFRVRDRDFENAEGGKIAAYANRSVPGGGRAILVVTKGLSLFPGPPGHRLQRRTKTVAARPIASSRGARTLSVPFPGRQPEGAGRGMVTSALTRFSPSHRQTASTASTGAQRSGASQSSPLRSASLSSRPVPSRPVWLAGFPFGFPVRVRVRARARARESVSVYIACRSRLPLSLLSGRGLLALPASRPSRPALLVLSACRRGSLPLLGRSLERGPTLFLGSVESETQHCQQ